MKRRLDAYSKALWCGVAPKLFCCPSVSASRLRRAALGGPLPGSSLVFTATGSCGPSPRTSWRYRAARARRNLSPRRDRTRPSRDPGPTGSATSRVCGPARPRHLRRPSWCDSDQACGSGTSLFAVGNPDAGTWPDSVTAGVFSALGPSSPARAGASPAHPTTSFITTPRLNPGNSGGGPEPRPVGRVCRLIHRRGPVTGLGGGGGPGVGRSIARTRRSSPERVPRPGRLTGPGLARGGRQPVPPAGPPVAARGSPTPRALRGFSRGSSGSPGRAWPRRSYSAT